jgi:cytochrome c biogenesis protein CcdA
MQLPRKKILQIGSIYIAGIFAAYLLIGLGILHALVLFNVPHFMGILGATLLVLFGLINIANEFFPQFPIKLQLPAFAHRSMASLMNRASVVAAFALGLLVGACQFPCMGGPYLMVIGLLHDKMTYFAGFGYLLLYNAILVIPLVVVLWISSDKVIVEKAQQWKREKTKGVRLYAGIAMILLGILIFFL